MSAQATTEFVAIPDPPEIQKANPIHAEGAKAYGYDRPIVAGLSSYGWAAAALIEVLGEEWLDFGWADMAFRRPVFEGDHLVTTATLGNDGACTYMQVNDGGKATVEGRAGLGHAPFRDAWQLPTRRDPVPAASERPLLMPEQAPVGVDYPPMAVSFTADSAGAWSVGRLDDQHPRYSRGEHPQAHPSWVPGHMTPLIRHSYRFAAGFHTTGRVQYLQAIRAPAEVVVAGRWVGNEERRGKWWSTTDAVFLAADGSELAYCQQAQILLPPVPR
jgi:hypothetical protein